MKLCCGIALAALVACNKTAVGGAGGTIVLSIDSKEAVDHIDIHAYAPDAQETEFDFSVTGKDLTKAPVTGEVTPGPTISGGAVMFVGFGYANSVLVASGRVPAEFVPNKRTTASLTLRGGVVDADQDGWTVADGDCDDNNSKANPFLTEVCGDNIDNNCDGSIDEGCACPAGTTLSCYAGPPGTKGLGVCTDGTQTCLNGKWDTCRNSVGPTDEQCNDDKDNNCDGSIDEGCPCAAGSSRFCFRTIAELVGEPMGDLNLKGECRAGTQTCIGTAWGACVGFVLPKAETCNGLDDDCDGVFDNGFDADGDGYTSCGTKHDSCVPGMATNVIGGTDPQFVDCDDAKVNVHPCQKNFCDDGGLDLNCSGQINLCSLDATCASLGYFAGLLPQLNAIPICRTLAGDFRSSCEADHFSCTQTTDTASVQAECAATNGALANGSATYSHAICNTVGGCDAGSTTPAIDTTPITGGSDPYAECGGLACQDSSGGGPYYFGTSAGTNTGWDYAGGVFRCRYVQNAAAGAVGCKAAGTCQVQSDVCPTQPKDSTTSAMNVGACFEPKDADLSGGVVNGSTNLGSTCFATTAPQQTKIADDQPDPLSRCPGSGMCANKVDIPWANTATTPTCTYFSADPAQTLCEAGVCGDASNGGCAGASMTVATCADPACYIASACGSAGAAAGPVFCYNDKGGTRGSHVATTCGGSASAGRACYGATDSTSACHDCVKDFACGPTCKDCGAQTCKENATGHAVCTDNDCDCY